VSYNIAVVDFKLPDNFDEAVELVNPMIEIDIPESQIYSKSFMMKLQRSFHAFAACRMKKLTMGCGVTSFNRTVILKLELGTACLGS